MPHLGDTLNVAELVVGQLARVEHLPLENTEAPDIRGRREAAISDCFRRHPADRTRDVRLGMVDGVVLWELSKQAKVSHFTELVITD